MIITMDGKQIEVTGTSTATTQAAVELVLRRAFEADSEAAREDDTATSQAPDSEGTRSSGGAENE
ncbi:hypothetical protein [Streptomyces sp. NPDC006333]|uniref:hypothetical protein n=1 Tax=Streptomyces sp. NPDC006333 TaxID=3156753 RepID=UPI0033A47A0F